MKPFPAAATKKNAPTRVGRPAAHKALAGAHALLIHGFLVELAVKPSRGAPAAKAAAAASSAGLRPPRPFPATTKHEGPADDSTFH